MPSDPTPSVPVSGETERLRKALRFYANHHNHAGVGVSAVYRDRGDTARRALGECSTCRGRGYVETGEIVWDQDGRYRDLATCLDCDGTGIAAECSRALDA